MERRFRGGAPARARYRAYEVVEEYRLIEWREAERRVEREELVRRRTLIHLTDLLLAELRRRVGQPFVLRELIDEYERGTDWAVALITDAAPRHPWAWAPGLAVDAAFSRYARFARDVGGGRWTGSKRTDD